MNAFLEIKSNTVAKEFTVSFKNKVILQHSSTQSSIELAHNEPAFRMNPRFIAYYKLKNKISNKICFSAFTIGKEKEIPWIQFDNLIRLNFKEVDGRLEIEPRLITNSTDGKTLYNHFTINLPSGSDEPIYGCGEQFSFLNLRGRCMPLWTQEPGIVKKPSLIGKIADLFMGAGGTWWSTYYPQPTFVSAKNYFVHIESYAYGEFDFRENNINSLRINEIPTKIVIDVQNSALDTLNSLSKFLGRQRPLPDWVMNGAILGIGGGLDKSNPNSVPNKVDRAKQAKTKIAAIWSEDWTGLREFKAQTRLFWNWKYSQTMYPDLPKYIQELRAEGIHYMGYNNCFLMLDGDLFEYARDHGYLVKTKTGEPYNLRMFSFYAVLLDLTNPGTISWFKELIKEHMIGIGLDGWMCDFAEYLPIDSSVHSKQNPYVHHNEYPVLWAKLNEDAVREMGRDKGDDAVVFFSRSGNYGTTRNSPLIWAGDQIMDFWLDSGLGAAICSGISLGFVGVGQTHADIAGEFRFPWMKRSKELFMRGTEYSAFTCVMRTHEAKGKSGWTLDSDKETLDHFAKFSRIHAHLTPYLHKAIEDYTQTGVPVIRHAYLHYENDPILHAQKPRSLQYQYLLGRDLLIAPVYLKGDTTRKLYLPKDDWIHVWSGKEFNGGWITVNAPCGEPPVFYRKSSPFLALFQQIKIK